MTAVIPCTPRISDCTQMVNGTKLSFNLYIYKSYKLVPQLLSKFKTNPKLLETAKSPQSICKPSF